MRTGEVIELALVPGSGCDERLFAPQIDALEGTAHTHVVGNTVHSRPRAVTTRSCTPSSGR